MVSFLPALDGAPHEAGMNFVPESWTDCLIVLGGLLIAVVCIYLWGGH